jgi:superfamily II DNA/RNA helicase
MRRCDVARCDPCTPPNPGGADDARAGGHLWSFTLTSFSDLGVPADLADRLAADGLTKAFRIQVDTIPDALAGRDLCGRAPTGSGKTLAFALPIAARVGRATPGRPRALILTPTRELAAQIRDTLRPLTDIRRRRVATFYGGTSIASDQQRLRRGVDVAVACPGRLADLVERGDVDLSDVDIVVLDEADRLADMGFLPEVKRLVDRTSPRRQTLLFSATLDGDVDDLVRRYQKDPARHEVRQTAARAGDVRHLFWAAERSARRGVTADIVRCVSPAIVFTRTKRGAERLARQLAKDGVSTAAIHGDRSQRQREQALARFARGDVTTLVATDVAARGIHVDDVGVVVHYDLAGTDKDYLHRSGRTGRAGAGGVVVTLVAEDQHRDVEAIQRSLGLPRGMHGMRLDHLTTSHVPAAKPVRDGQAAHADQRGRTGPTTRGPNIAQDRGRASRGGNRKARRRRTGRRG